MKTYPYLVHRGGSCDNYPRPARVADRFRYSPGRRSCGYLGLRLVRSKR